MSDRTKVTKHNDWTYFTITPWLVHAEARNTFDKTLWDTVKMIAGDAGECYLSTDDLAILSMMSIGQVVNCRTYLISRGLLAGEVRKDPGFPQPVWHLSIPDLWQRNAVFAKQYQSLRDRIDRKERQCRKCGELDCSLHQVKPSPGEGGSSPGEEGPLPGEGGSSPGEAKNIELKIEKENQKEPSQVWQIVLDQLAMEMPRTSFEWVRDTTKVIGFQGNVLRVSARNSYGRDWLTERLTSTVNRMLVGIFGETVKVEFCVGEA